MDKLFDWKITLSADTITVMVDDSGKLNVTSLRMGEPPLKPYGYLWESSDPSVVTIDADGVYTAHTMGEAVITCRLRENPNITAAAVIKVEEMVLDNYMLTFDPAPPDRLRMYQSVTLECHITNNGVRTTEPVSFAFSGVSGQYYSVSNRTGNSVRVTCNAAAPNLLTVTASAEVSGKVVTAATQIRLLGV